MKSFPNLEAFLHHESHKQPTDSKMQSRDVLAKQRRSTKIAAKPLKVEKIQFDIAAFLASA